MWSARTVSELGALLFRPVAVALAARVKRGGKGIPRRPARRLEQTPSLVRVQTAQGADLPPRDVRQRRKRFLELAQDFVPYVIEERDGQLHVLATDDPTHGNLFAKKRSKELRALTRALECLEAVGVEISGTTFVDIGANTGTATLAALKAGFSSVVACEPAPSTFRLLRANLVLNDVEGSVRPLQVALSNRRGTGMLDLGSRSRKARVLAGESCRGSPQQIRLMRLDDLVADGELDPAEVGMVFMDVEGHECHVLEGAGGVLQGDAPLVMELNPALLRLGGKIDELADLLGRHYTHVLDLRDNSDPAFRPVDQVDALINAIGGGVTDILACRLPEAARGRYGARQAVSDEYADLQAFCLFVGYPRSGHSLIGALLDAHPDVVIAHEANALRLAATEGTSRRLLFETLRENSRHYARSGRKSSGRSHAVQGQWQGRVRTLRVIGDKAGQKTGDRLSRDRSALAVLEGQVRLPLRLVHATRNPYDTVARMALIERGARPERSVRSAIAAFARLADVGDKLIADGEFPVLSVRHESFIQHPQAELRRLCEFLGVGAEEAYLDACAGIVASSPQRTRELIDWSQQEKDAVEEIIVRHSFFHGYSWSNGS